LLLLFMGEICVYSFVKMVFFSEEDKTLIKNLRQLKGYTSTRFLREFETKNWTRRGLDYLLAKIDHSGSIDCVAGSGRPRTARATGNVAVVEEMALSQEDKQCTHCTVQQIARESGIHRSSVHHIMKQTCSSSA